ncbi:hypothetical protein MNBD_CHLOROFLEXI01-113 [hydrothermal vent metagenome]|uniref:Uncharacterized protein n=1 Tax=hydrothermal vent metagenome TaxID=652676 RepID=A0A3B0WGF3_9ZZZZ
MLELPSEIKNPIKLADWMEVLALILPDKNVSYGDLSSALRRTGAYELNEENPEESSSLQDERIDEMCGEVFDELNRREKSASHGYPFLVQGSLLELKTHSTWEDYVAYVFCLCLSYFGSLDDGVVHFPRRLFESLSKFAAERFIDGEAVKLSPPREELPTSFEDAINEICLRIGEGDGYRKQRKDSRIRPQDDRVDIIAWKHFSDQLPSKLIIFGQCASNKNWEGWRPKLIELQPREFCEQWMQKNPSPIPIKSFFVPHRIDYGRWDYAARYAGILFDRCRIAFWAHGASEFEPQRDWVRKSCLSSLL